MSTNKDFHTRGNCKKRYLHFTDYFGQIYLKIITWCFLILFLTCEKHYNPFNDISNSKLFIDASFEKIDSTKQIFASESISVTLAVPELIDSIRIFAPGNRFFAQKDSVLYAPFLISDLPLKFKFSYSDTGWKTIVVSAYKENFPEQNVFRIFTANPCTVKNLYGKMGDTVTLTSNGVVDKDVFYNWQIGQLKFVSRSRIFSQVFRLSTDVRNGYLWITDTTQKNFSPKVEFSVSLIDTNGPIISPLFDSTRIEFDTLVFKKKTSYIPFKIFDKECGKISTVQINDSICDYVEPSIYLYSNENQLYGLTNEIRVVAYDAFGNKSEKKFWSRFDSLINNINYTPKVVVQLPPFDSMVFGYASIPISGYVENLSKEYLREIQLFVNDTFQVNYNPRNESVYEDWFFENIFKRGQNRYKIALVDSNNHIIASQSRVITIDPNMNDTIGPIFVEIARNKKVLDSIQFYSENEITLRIIAFDQGSGLKEVQINQSRANLVNGSRGFLWEFNLDISSAHRVLGLPVRIRAVDNKNQITDTNFVIIKNSKPVFIKYPQLPIGLNVGQRYYDTLQAQDSDFDDLTYAIIQGPLGMTIDSKRGLITWEPTISDTGKHTLKIQANDSLQNVVCTFEIQVMNENYPYKPLSFRLDTIGNVTLRESLKDTVICKLQIDSTTGRQPYQLKAILKNGTRLRELPLNNGVLRWIPSLIDTGKNELSFYLQDKLNLTAQKTLSCKVLPPNRPCKINIDSTDIKFTNNCIDLSTTQMVKTINFKILDPDTLESFQLTTFRNNISITQNIMLDKFSITFDPKNMQSLYDTVLVSIRDKSSHLDSMQLVFYSGNFLRIFKTSNLAVDTLFDTSTITLHWNALGPNSEQFRFDVYWGDSISLNRVGTNLNREQFNIQDLKKDSVYYWKVVVKNGLDSASSQIYKVRTQQTKYKISIRTNLITGMAQAVYKFPIALTLTNSKTKLSLYGTNGNKLKFTQGNSPLPFEIEHWDTLNGVANIWVLVDSIQPNNSNQFITLSRDLSNGESNLNNNVFKSSDGYLGVWHLARPGAENLFKDACGRSDLFPSSSFPQSQGGVFGDALVLNGIGQYLMSSQENSFNLSSNLSLEMWVNPQSNQNSSSKVLPLLNKGTNSYYFQVNQDNQKFEIGVFESNLAIWHSISQKEMFQHNTWYHLVMVYKEPNLEFFVNGVSQGKILNCGRPKSNTFPLHIGIFSADKIIYTKCMLDEIRVSNTIYDNSRVLLSYENQKPGSQLIKIE